MNGSRWRATVQIDGRPSHRGPFPFEAQAVAARRLMVEAQDKGLDVPGTSELRKLVADVEPFEGEEYVPTMRERQALARA